MPIVAGQIQGISLDQIKMFNRHTGKPMYETDHVVQSVTVILTTPKGTRVMRRNFGSNLYKLIDRPINDDLKLQIYYETAEALREWEPRIKLTKVILRGLLHSAGHIIMDLYGKYLIDGTEFVMRDLTLDFKSENKYSLLFPNQ